MLKVALVALLLAVFSAVAVSAFSFEAGDDGIQATDETFKTVVSGPQVSLVSYTAPWCGHCKNLKPQAKLAATALRGIAKVVNVDADGAGRATGQKAGVQGFPTIKLFGASKKKPTDYEGGRTAADLVRGVMDEIEKTALARIAKLK
jgi:protein disulfide-isomerase A6